MFRPATTDLTASHPPRLFGHTYSFLPLARFGRGKPQERTQRGTSDYMSACSDRLGSDCGHVDRSEVLEVLRALAKTAASPGRVGEDWKASDVRGSQAGSAGRDRGSSRVSGSLQKGRGEGGAWEGSRGEVLVDARSAMAVLIARFLTSYSPVRIIADSCHRFYCERGGLYHLDPHLDPLLRFVHLVACI
jgi:hypothetical protein